MATRSRTPSKTRPEHIDLRDTSGAPEKRLKSYLDDEGIIRSFGDRGFLPDLIRKSAWSLNVADYSSTKSDRRNIWRFRMEVPEDEDVEAFQCESVGFGFRANKKASLTVQVMQHVVSGKAGRMTTTFTGDLNVILPRTGLVPVGMLRRPTTTPARIRERFKVAPDMTALIRGGSRVELPLNKAMLLVDVMKDSVRVVPSLDVKDRVFRIAETGVLVTFDSVSVSCVGTEPKINFRGGRLWKQD